MTTVAIMLCAFVLDALVGWPAWLYDRIGHPVSWLGKLISRLDKSLNRTEWHRSTRKVMGIVAALFVILGSIFLGRFVQSAFGEGVLGFILSVLVVWPLIAVNSMYTHVEDVAVPLEQNQLTEARAAVSLIVGRNPNVMDSPAIGRAAIESLAENTSDGIVAPIFWGVIFGIPGIFAYKAINTLDSMLGYKTPKHFDFGWASAKIDDVANFFPARLTGWLIALASGNRKTALAVINIDARKHRSPNAGWPEGAMAGALGVRLSGPREYETGLTDDPWLNENDRDVEPKDVNQALAVFKQTMFGLAAILAVLTIFLGI
ncbi:MAG: adenosylcobinamide-phosphate synthase CbiB [Paracoccaceae bacterium]|jgi:adenosylcobinamide-phosphate synthase|nr:adenosylcobinamide-phosphate synthase CbiB [Paracoccaceae bacterium]